MAISQVSLGFTSGLKLFLDTVNANAAIAVVASAATLYQVQIDNSANSVPNFVKLYDTAGAVVVGTTVPDHLIRVPANVSRTILCPEGLAFANGIAVATVTAGGTAGTTSPTNPVIVRLAYTS